MNLVLNKSLMQKFYLKHNVIVKLLLITSVIFVCNPKVSAGSYDIYVDHDYDGDEEGTSDKPFNTIQEALDEADSMGKKIYIKNGNYEERITLSKGVELYGQDRNKTIITGKDLITHTVTAIEKNKLENLTISGGSVAVTLKGDGEIKNCIIKNAKNKGIDLVSGGADFKIEKSKITNNGGKGIYVQRGRRIEIINNEFYENYGEGIDIREKIEGVISDNEIRSNKESGIELIVGRSNLRIMNNNIRNNKASGIAAQFYDHADRSGKILIINNNLVSNSSYGVNCKAPSGGSIPKGYWDESIELLDNKIQSNKKKSVAGACKFIQAVSEEEEKSNETTEDPDAQPEEITVDENNAEAAIAEENERNARDNERNARDTETRIKEEKNNIDIQVFLKKQAILKEDKIKIYFVGRNNEPLNSIRRDNENLRIKIPVLQEAMSQIDSAEITQSIQQLIEEINYQVQENENFIREEEKVFSLWGWIRNLFNNKLNFR
jgi:parallel beta-helix repeat protein